MGFMEYLKAMWLWMVEPPWHHTGLADERTMHWFVWLIGWAWTVAGLAIGALAGPVFVLHWGLTDSPYQDPVVIGVALLAGFLVQFVGWCLAGLAFAGAGEVIENSIAICLLLLPLRRSRLCILSLSHLGWHSSSARRHWPDRKSAHQDASSASLQSRRGWYVDEGIHEVVTRGEGQVNTQDEM